jgi:hypothetical protein
MVGKFWDGESAEGPKDVSPATAHARQPNQDDRKYCDRTAYAKIVTVQASHGAYPQEASEMHDLV